MRRRVFTEYLRSFDAAQRSFPAALFDELWTALRAALVSELRKQGLWRASPAHLGVCGHERWDSRGPEGREEALEELLTDCYLFTFVQRAWSLRAQLAVKENLDGLVFLNIRHFLIERQRRHDPLGSQVFRLLRAAVRESVAAGELRLLTGDAGIGDSVLGFSQLRRLPAAEPDWETLASGWSDALLPDLVTARGPRKRRVVAEARRLLRQLPGAGVDSFAFGALLRPLQREVRARWRALARQEAGEMVLDAGDTEMLELVKVVHPDTAWEDEQSYAELAARVERRIAHEVTSQDTKRHLNVLWDFLCGYATGTRAVEPEAGPERLPSQRRLSVLLGIPRNLLPQLLATLRDFALPPPKEANRAVTDVMEGQAVRPIAHEERRHER